MTTKDYSSSKIYKIQPKGEFDEGYIYIGSTTKKYLSQRMAAHKYEYKCWLNGSRHKYSCFDIFDKYGVDNCEMILIESYNCNSFDELQAKEGYYIKLLKCINYLVAGRDDKQYQIDKKDIILQRKKQFYENNKEALLEKSKVKYSCECGAICRVYAKQKHFRTIKHQKYLETLNI